jgi:hypothetical protein
MSGIEAAGILLLQEVPPRALIVAMLISYTLCFAGMIFAYLSWRRRRRDAGKQTEERKP